MIYNNTSKVLLTLTLGRQVIVRGLGSRSLVVSTLSLSQDPDVLGI